MLKRETIQIKGVVQGIGFRPFIYSLAYKYSLKGVVYNNTHGVLVDVEGDEISLRQFLLRVKQESPPLSRIDTIDIEQLPFAGYRDFSIQPSTAGKEKFVLVSPDIATCDECRKELGDPLNKRYGYPFINCTNCGPRFTIIKDIPYDRDKTTMAKFRMCAECQSEYDNPVNRRFHAQPDCCHICGPSLSLLDREGIVLCVDDHISHTSQLLKNGKIVAIKGLGGFHLACDAENYEVVAELRRRKKRDTKPFAIMVKDIQKAKTFCRIGRFEEILLLSSKRPIVLLKVKKFSPIVDNVAPGQKYLGVMLPYTPLHHLILNKSDLSLVMTSGNRSDEPIVYRNSEAMERLGDIADYFLFHNRDIYNRCDDSVTRVFDGSEILIRRSRGYVPEPIEFPTRKQILACGAELKNTFCVTRDGYAFLSHYVGDLENLETLNAYEDGIEHFKKLFSIEPEIIAYDLHPEYLATKYAKQMLENSSSLLGVSVQHHHAHIVSCMVDNRINERVIGVAFDGLGFGTDGNLWGGEFLTADFKNFHRIAHFRYTPMPGASQAIKEPYRMAISYLYQTYGEAFHKLDIEFLRKRNREKSITIKKMVMHKINAPVTSSVGRLFDAVSSLLGICERVTYEGEAAIGLEMAIEFPHRQDKERQCYNYTISEEKSMFIIEPESIIRGVVEDIKRCLPTGIISFKFHHTIASIVIDMCDRIRDKTDLETVVLSGGVFQNMFLLKETKACLGKEGFNVFTHHRVPTNDGGISLGQAAVAGYRVREL